MSILANGALLLAYLQAPSLHAHHHETTQGHKAAFFHTHLAHAEVLVSTQNEFRAFDPDDDAQFLTWFSTNPSGRGFAPAVCPASNFAVPVQEVIQCQTMVLWPSAHDPPVLNSTTPRAPPV